MLTALVICSFSLLIGTGVLLYLNWRILQVTEALLKETMTIRKDTKVMKGDTKRVANSFEIEV